MVCGVECYGGVGYAWLGCRWGERGWRRGGGGDRFDARWGRRVKEGGAGGGAGGEGQEKWVAVV